jgi:glucose/arabinose dehydrogenase
MASGQGGLLDIVLHPQHAENGVLFISYAGATPNGAATHVLRARLDGDRLVDRRVILVGGASGTGRHYGSRLAFDRNGLLYASLGDRGQMDRAQDLSDLVGKIVRITDDGGIPRDNPFVGRMDARPEIYPGFPIWIRPTRPKALETLAKRRIPTFTLRVHRDSAT